METWKWIQENSTCLLTNFCEPSSLKTVGSKTQMGFRLSGETGDSVHKCFTSSISP
jgi:hypothetical protein